MIATLLKGKQPDLASLEQAVADAASAVAKARQAHRNARERHAEAVATLAEVPNSEALSDQVSHMLDEMSARGDVLGHAMERLAEAERLLTVAREAPERRQNAAALRGQAAIVELLGDLGPLTSELRDLMLSVNFSVADLLPEGGTHEFRRLFGLIDELGQHFKAGRLRDLADHLRLYASKMEDGFVARDLGPTFHQLVGHRLTS